MAREVLILQLRLSRYTWNLPVTSPMHFSVEVARSPRGRLHSPGTDLFEPDSQLPTAARLSQSDLRLTHSSAHFQLPTAQ